MVVVNDGLVDREQYTLVSNFKLFLYSSSVPHYSVQVFTRWERLQLSCRWEPYLYIQIIVQGSPCLFVCIDVLTKIHKAAQVKSNKVFKWFRLEVWNEIRLNICKPDRSITETPWQYHRRKMVLLDCPRLRHCLKSLKSSLAPSDIMVSWRFFTISCVKEGVEAIVCLDGDRIGGPLYYSTQTVYEIIWNAWYEERGVGTTIKQVRIRWFTTGWESTVLTLALPCIGAKCNTSVLRRPSMVVQIGLQGW